MSACPTCSKVNGPSFRFCMGCGAALPRRTLPPSAFEEPLWDPPPRADSTPPPEAVTWTATARPGPTPSRLALVAIAIDGSTRGSHRLPEGTVAFGRNRGGELARDRYLSPEHFAVTPRGERLLVEDRGSLNGVYRKLRAGDSVRLESGQTFRVGRELLRFDAPPSPRPSSDGVESLGVDPLGCVGRLVVVHDRTRTGDAFPVMAGGLLVGRERGDVRFPEDAFVSGTHCRIGVEQGLVWLTDLGSSNGTFLRIRETVEVAVGEILLVGLQLFRVALASR
ncbi:MAG: FHA domain-containing protein [Deltaproteobacteria bacterium]|nr:FHA domain-containing protein [Deltaproteobacteria bacterium]